MPARSGMKKKRWLHPQRSNAARRSARAARRRRAGRHLRHHFGGNWIGRRLSHTLTILGVLIAFVISAMTLKSVAIDGARFNQTIYEWMVVGGLKMEIGFLVDGLTAMMMCVVTFVSLMVHIYTIGYMEEDEGYNRFFAYISLFTFSC
jgi:NADH-quinone oxidoreductase subunit L